MGNNVIEFPIYQIFDRDTFDKCQLISKDVAGDRVENSGSLEEYALSLAMASGHALKFVKEQHPEIWDEIGEALEVIAHGGGLSHDQ